MSWQRKALGCACFGVALYGAFGCGVWATVYVRKVVVAALSLIWP